MSKNISSLSSRRGLEDGLFEGLVRTGSGDVEGRRKLAEDFLVGEAVTCGANSFYDFLKDDLGMDMSGFSNRLKGGFLPFGQPFDRLSDVFIVRDVFHTSLICTKSIFLSIN